MLPAETHPWGLTPADARALQETLAARVVLDNHAPARPAYIAGVDVSGAFSDGETLGAVVVMTWPGLEIAEVRVARKRPPMPYTPGLLSFRETPVLIDALAKLVHRPDILIADGHGIAHPRRFGIASHLGLLFDVPAIGLAKSRLVGRADVPGPRRGSLSPLIHRGEVIGAALRTREGVSPVFVSAGHKTDLETAAHWVLATAVKYRLPEPTRLAHHAASGKLAPGLS